MMDFLGDENRTWAENRWRELLNKIPDLKPAKLECLLESFRDVGIGMHAIGGFLEAHTPTGRSPDVDNAAIFLLTTSREMVEFGEVCPMIGDDLLLAFVKALLKTFRVDQSPPSPGDQRWNLAVLAELKELAKNRRRFTAYAEKRPGLDEDSVTVAYIRDRLSGPDFGAGVADEVLLKASSFMAYDKNHNTATEGQNLRAFITSLLEMFENQTLATDDGADIAETKGILSELKAYCRSRPDFLPFAAEQKNRTKAYITMAYLRRLITEPPPPTRSPTEDTLLGGREYAVFSKANPQIQSDKALRAKFAELLLALFGNAWLTTPPSTPKRSGETV